MRVAIVYHHLPHYRAAVFRELLASPQHEYVLVADTTSVESSIPTWRVDDPSRFKEARCHKLAGQLIFQEHLCKLALSHEFDAIIYLASINFLSTWLSATIARLTGKKVLFWMHGWTRHESRLSAFIRQSYYTLANGFLLYGHKAKAMGVSAGFDAARIHVIYNSLDYRMQKELRDSIGRSEIEECRRGLFEQPELPIVICSARLNANCQFDMLLEAVKYLKDHGHHVNVLLIGDGPERAKLEALAAKYSLPVKFWGSCYEERQIAVLTMAAAVTVSPGKVGLTAMQSLAYGVPVITHDAWYRQMPEYEAIIPNVTGALFKLDNVTDLASCIRQWTSAVNVSEETKHACYAVIEERYNPVLQRILIDRAISGHEADDELWLQPARS